jgi:amino acid adenylation domain-containing protein
MSTTEQFVSSLSPEKRAMLEEQLLARARKPQTNRTIPNRLPAESYPLSFAQERMWVLEQLYPDSTIYNEQSAYRFVGQLNRAALEQSIQAITQRHEVLRTVYREIDGIPVQVILPESEVSLPAHDFSHLPRQEQETAIQRITTQDARQPFHLAKGPVQRMTLIRLSDSEHVLIRTQHHIASDGWSSRVFWREFNELYNAYCSERAPSLPPLPIQYADYALWQREWLAGERGEQQLVYWREHLANLSPLELPTDSPRSSDDYEGSSVQIILPPELAGQLQVLAKRETATLFMVLAAALQLLLYRHTNRTDIAIGTPVANRNLLEIEQLIGCFLNTLVIRTDLSGNPTFAELLQRVRTTVLDALRYQDVPYEKILEELQPARQFNRSSLFHIFINMLDMEPASPQLDELVSEPIQLDHTTSKFDLTLYLRRTTDGMRLRMVYRSDFFSPARIAHLLQQYVHLLAQIVLQPDRPLEAFSLVTPESRTLLPDPTQRLEEVVYPGVLEEFLEVSTANPEAVAIEQGDQHWTYGELAATASAIAAALHQHGLRPHQVVAVTGRRSFELVASIVGVMLCGGVFMPLDPNLPAKRREMMLADAKAVYLISIQQDAADGDHATTISLTALAGEHAAQPAVLTPVVPRSFQPASYEPNEPLYIFFTSGSSGRPKGILGRYNSLSHFIQWQRDTFQVDATDRIAQLTMLSFDPILRDLFLPLTSGATLCLPPKDLLPAEELRWLEQSKITILHIVPSRVRLWLHHQESTPVLSLRYTFFAGEALPGVLARSWLQVCPPKSRIVNLYGPTETTLAKSYYLLPRHSSDATQPIGIPQPGVQLLIINRDNQLCGIGEPGEIVIRTPYSSLGYLNPTPEDTERFQINWFTQQPEDILYRTGDQGRYLPDGNISILGRLDHQIKIHGVRVELQEIESLLSRHPGVSNCAVVPYHRTAEAMELAAYIVSKQEPLDSNELRRHLALWLPITMLPSAFVSLPSLPLLPNGKIDRQALAALQVPVPSFEVVEAKTEVEKMLVGLWEDLLRVKGIGVNQSFFELGGDSLLAIRLFSEVERLTGMRLPLATLFNAPTVRQMCDTLLERLLDDPEQATDLSSTTSIDVPAPRAR